MVIHGVPNTFKTFSSSFSKVNLNFDGIEDLSINGWKPFKALKKAIPFNLKQFQEKAAEMAGLPPGKRIIINIMGIVDRMDYHFQ
jgi:hypothetical protein